MKKRTCAIIGTGFWANYQIPAWQELDGVEIVAVYNRTLSRGQQVAKKFGIGPAYDDAARMLQEHKPDFVDIITDVDTHAAFTKLAATHRADVICQKPMAPSYHQASEMLQFCEQQQVKLFIHENFRWQAPIRALKKILDSGRIGTPFKARISFCSGFPVFENQPFLAELEHFILTDVGSHVLDVSRFLFGEARSVYCQTRRVNPNIRGEDVANVFLEMQGGLHCFVEMSYASILEKESFPQTLVLVEGDKGSVALGHDFELKMTTRQGTTCEISRPVMYPWLDPDYAVVHASIVECNRNILLGLNGGNAETTGSDNLKTVALVWASYASAAEGRVIYLS
ncbi:Gfo/Idh/MocA family protein [Arundinibacter roseus]|uniref:Gfo/Idh/MocA family oxidoreductase n=1 Tax=Arundinibacter roseus TaxID=2070510 RepID=A0A4R4JZD9_9BACT|nr:Gfo/Idh/MocA family oxidoreductase [Arundinibacter roseus]TDB59542.1 Gfo/Idh/MocA family oxidoreductase [Arundinibacter roseus]